MATIAPLSSPSAIPVARSQRWGAIVTFSLAAILLALVYGPTLYGIAGSWFDENADVGHGMAVPLVAAYIAWTKRKKLAKITTKPSILGLPLVLWGASQFVVSAAADWVFATRTAFVISLIGVVLAIWGWEIFKALAFPLGLLFLMIAPPSFLQAKITFPLQLIASTLAERSLDTLGYSVLREGNILELVGERLAVAEACSGIRALFSLFFFCLIYNYFFVESKPVRWLLLLSVIPVALLANAGRIVATGVIGQYNRELAHGIMHENLGYLSILAAGAMLLGVHAILSRVMPKKRRAANA